MDRFCRDPRQVELGDGGVAGPDPHRLVPRLASATPGLVP